VSWYHERTKTRRVVKQIEQRMLMTKKNLLKTSRKPAPLRSCLGKEIREEDPSANKKTGTTLEKKTATPRTTRSKVKVGGGGVGREATDGGASRRASRGPNRAMTRNEDLENCISKKKGGGTSIERHPLNRNVRQGSNAGNEPNPEHRGGTEAKKERR